MIKEFPWGGKCSGHLSPGCRACQLGHSTVIFVTGMCNAKCYYCPVGLDRMFHSEAYANERQISSLNDLIDEVLACKSEAASLTGGDPLLDPEKCYVYAKTLKERFGTKFYIHLYTPGREGSPEIFAKLSQVIDEIRFHPKNLSDVDNLVMALEYKWNVGIELPAVPGLHKQMFFQEYVKKYAEGCKKYHKKYPFINLNEMEVNERNHSNIIARGLIDLDFDFSFDKMVPKSRDEAETIITFFQKKYPEISVHFCPAAQKDGVQLPNRLLHRAHSIMLPSDFVLEDWTEVGMDRGLLIRGVIRSKDSIDLLNESSKLDYFDKIRKELIDQFDIPTDQISLDLQRSQLLTRADFLEETIDELKHIFPNLIFGMVEEYPTADRLEVSYIEF